ncbi:undecaprenyl-diphosphate phosphatase [Arenibaculum pallidiluteum]|uniref:undecaprenyl-diphosphate phosphatase n=1 Tax=Arenibaculum pallidiluteum TaxID=2812559 RepID=UPI001A9762B2|nr:undecaprenyl-diphosphate phosphatase [Arenibaculum pallidiluteum]
MEYIQAAILGLVEGLTEFLPISSTGHLILLVDLLGFQGPEGRVFEVVIQFGAILAVILAYFGRLWRVAVGLPTDPDARRFAIAVILAFLPAVVIGVLARDFIKTVLFSPWVVSWALILGGIAILLIERRQWEPRHFRIERFPIRLTLGIGLAQCLAMIPGVSRSGATILGGLLLGVDRKTAMEFSFFLAIPTMLGAASYDLYKSRDLLNSNDALLIVVGFVVAFLAALAVVRTVLAFIGRYGFTPFGWYRIVLGAVMLGVLSLR